MEIALPPVPGAEDVGTAEDVVITSALEECLEAMDRGETDLDELSGRYPEAEDQIRPLLEIAQQLRQQCCRDVSPSPEFREELRQMLLNHDCA